jgi:hypothetical protein
MFNFLINELPTTFEGYQIDSDFKTGILISQCLSDKELTREEQICTAIDLLFDDNKPDIETAITALIWFMNAGKEKQKKTKLELIEEEVNGVTEETEQQRVYDFEIDSAVLWTGFLKTYNIDLMKVELHWWQFLALIDDLDDCAFNKRLEIRTKKIDGDMSAKEKDYWTKAKAHFAIEQDEEYFSEEELENYKQFLLLVKEGG